MADATVQDIATIHDLEKRYYISLHATELLYRDEEARLAQLRELKLRDDAVILDDEIWRRDDQMRDLIGLSEKMRSEMSLKQSQCNKQALDLAVLKAEVESLNSAIKDSDVVVQEKFALARELDHLRPEMEHLKAQLADHRKTALEKLNLHQQLTTMKIELEAEKRQRKLETEKNARLEFRLEEAEKQAVAARKQQEEPQSEHEKSLSQSRGEMAELEKEIARLKAQVRGLQDELMGAQVNLKTSRAALQESRARSRQIQDQKKKIQSPQPKTTLALKKPKGGIALDTPGKDESLRRPVKKRATEQALQGGKSDFSITPFLSRSKSLIDESADDLSHIEDIGPSTSQAEDMSPEQLGQETSGAVPDDTFQTSQSLRTGGGPPKPRSGPLGKYGAGSSRLKATTQKSRSLSSVMEEEGKEEREKEQEIKAERPALRAADFGTIAKATTSATNAKRKRKLLGGSSQSIFEEEDVEALARVSQKPIEPRRLKAPLKSAVSAFSSMGTFSPLKRDRRGVHASFLA